MHLPRYSDRALKWMALLYLSVPCGLTAIKRFLFMLLQNICVAGCNNTERPAWEWLLHMICTLQQTALTGTSRVHQFEVTQMFEKDTSSVSLILCNHKLPLVLFTRDNPVFLDV